LSPGPDGVVIRPPTERDAEAGAGLTGRAWEATYRGMIPDPVLDEWIAGTPDGWRTLVGSEGDGSERAWVAERRGSLLGFATTSPGKDQWLPSPAGSGELRNLYLDPDAIGTGVGRLLYEHAIEDLRQRGFSSLVVWAFRENHRARAFYERMGLVLDAEHVWALGGVDCPIVRFSADWRHLVAG
jgi:GNAT superfamily N-acetyltransferase